MKDIDWDTLAELFQKALALSGVERETFLNDACAGNIALRNELESLLENSEEAPDFFGSLGDIVPALPAEEQPKDPLQEDPLQFVGKQIKNYKVTELLGAGGMGIVYKAEDLELDRPVALKFLPPRLSHDKKARERFIVEAKAASRLDQANICTVYEVGRTDEGWIFIAMAYYQGHTLKELIAEKRIPTDIALDYGTQICRGLSKAHANDIVHRDIKPANLMVTQDGIVKILDFGLAKIADQQLTQTGQTLGTASYMSPEQAKGGETDHRTDIWSLGALMYEMIGGEKPFKGNNPQSIIYSILNEKPAPIFTSSGAALQDTTASIINRCLAKNLDKRYQSADDVLHDLLAPLKKPTIKKSTPSRNLMLSAVLLALVIAGSFILLPLINNDTSQQADPNESSEIRIALLPFEGLPADDEDNQVLAAGLMQVVGELLPQLGTPAKPLWVIPPEEVKKASILNANSASNMLGANRSISGELKKRNNVVALSLKLMGPKGSDILETETSLIDEAAIIDTLGTGFHDQLVESLANLLGIQIEKQSLAIIQNAIPDDPDAYAFYVQGKGYLQRFDKEGYIGYAIQQFSQSIQADSLFAPSHAGLCEAIWEKYRRSNDQEDATKALGSCKKAGALSQENPDVLISLASIFLRTAEFDLAEDALRRAIAQAPDNAEAYRWLARVYEKREQPDSVVTMYQTAINLKQSRWTYYNDLGIYQHRQGALSSAIIQFERVRDLTPDNHLASNALGIYKQYLNEEEEAERLFRRSIELNSKAVEPRRNLGRFLFRQQRYKDAVSELEPAVASGDFVSRSYLAHALYWSGDINQANEVWEEVIGIAKARLQLNRSDFAAQTFLTDAMVSLDQFQEARPEIDKLNAYSDEITIANYFLGRIHERIGERDRAFGFLEKALAGNFDFYLIDRDPWLEDLRNDPRYAAFINQYRPNN